MIIATDAGEATYTGASAVADWLPSYNVLLEIGDSLLLEDGFPLLLETAIVGVLPGTGLGLATGYAPSVVATQNVVVSSDVGELLFTGYGVTVLDITSNGAYPTLILKRRRR